MSVSVLYVDSTPPKLYTSETIIPHTTAQITPCKLTYLNEGGANIIFHLTPTRSSPSSPIPPSLHHRLLRIRKNLPHVPRADLQLTTLTHTFAPLFPSSTLLSQSLIHLDLHLPSTLNTYLCTTISHQRPLHRRNPANTTNTSSSQINHDTTPASALLDPRENTAQLITDMSAMHPGQRLLQLKPKWLVQSPSAPKEARRCRTCALRARREAARNVGNGGLENGVVENGMGANGSVIGLNGGDGVNGTNRINGIIEINRKIGRVKEAESTNGHVGLKTRWCPLGLVNSDVESRREEARQVIGADGEAGTEDLVATLAEGAGWQVLERLKVLQAESDLDGVLTVSRTRNGSMKESGGAVEKLCVAMTLRDCTIFLRVGTDKANQVNGCAAAKTATGNVEVKVGDLDLKQSEKMDKWAMIEKNLIDEGWYMNQEPGEKWAKETTCILSQHEPRA